MRIQLDPAPTEVHLDPRASGAASADSADVDVPWP